MKYENGYLEYTFARPFHRRRQGGIRFAPQLTNTAISAAFNSELIVSSNPGLLEGSVFANENYTTTNSLHPTLSMKSKGLKVSLRNQSTFCDA